MLGLERVEPAPPDPCTLHPGDVGFVDEDGDGIDNHCDNCPAAFNQLQEDTDGDLVGDACDPHKGTFGDSLVAAEFFDGPLYSWTPNAASAWQLADGSIDTTGAAVATAATLSLSVPAHYPTLELGFTALAYSGPIDDIKVHLVVSGVELRCDFYNDTTTPQDGPYRIKTFDGGAYRGEDALSATLPVGVPSTLRFGTDMTTFTCAINSATASAPPDPPPPQTLDTATIDIDGMQATLQYALLYDFNP